MVKLMALREIKKKPLMRKIDKKVYVKVESHSYKTKAMNEAKAWRKKGYSARVINDGTYTTPYAIFVNPPPSYEFEHPVANYEERQKEFWERNKRQAKRTLSQEINKEIDDERQREWELSTREAIGED